MPDWLRFLAYVLALGVIVWAGWRFTLAAMREWGGKSQAKDDPPKGPTILRVAARTRPADAIFPPTRDHDLRFQGGKTIPDLIYANLYVGGQDAWNAADQDAIDKAMLGALTDAHLNNVLRQYFQNAPISATHWATQTLPGPKPAQVTQAEIEAWVAHPNVQRLTGGTDPTRTVWNFLLPRGTVLVMDDGTSSLNGLGGFHGSVRAAGTVVYYAVGVWSEGQNGISVFDQPWKNVCATFYHELCEFRTDPDVEESMRTNNNAFLGWTSDQGEECGDYPVFEAEPDLTRVMQEVPLADGSGTVPVQFQYSNAVHGPEGPIPTPHPLGGMGAAPAGCLPLVIGGILLGGGIVKSV